MRPLCPSVSGDRPAPDRDRRRSVEAIGPSGARSSRRAGPRIRADRRLPGPRATSRTRPPPALRRAVSYRPSRSIARCSTTWSEAGRLRSRAGGNSTDGAVNVTHDRLIDSEVVICGELRLDISQQLLSRAAELARSSVSSRTAGLGQCRAWLAEHARGPTKRSCPRPWPPRWRPPTPRSPRSPPRSRRALRRADLAGARRGQSAQLDPLPDHGPPPSARPDATNVDLFAMRTSPARSTGSSSRWRGWDQPHEDRIAPGQAGPWEYVIFVDLEGHRDTPIVSSRCARSRSGRCFSRFRSYPAL